MRVNSRLEVGNNFIVFIFIISIFGWLDLAKILFQCRGMNLQEGSEDFLFLGIELSAVSQSLRFNQPRHCEPALVLRFALQRKSKDRIGWFDDTDFKWIKNISWQTAKRSIDCSGAAQNEN